MGGEQGETNDVVVVGSGPTGLMLAAELTLAGVDVAVLERRVTPELVGSRAGGFHSRTLEVLDQRGIVDRFLAEGTVAQAVGFANVTLGLSDFPTRYRSRHGFRVNVGFEVESVRRDGKAEPYALESISKMRCRVNRRRLTPALLRLGKSPD